MSREKQIEEMAKIVLQEPHVGGLYGFDERIALRLYNAGYRKQIVGEWISVDEGLPEKDGKYLVYDIGQHRGSSAEEIRIAHFKSGDRYHDYMWRNHFSHWMPLPEPPKMKGGE